LDRPEVHHLEVHPIRVPILLTLEFWGIGTELPEQVAQLDELRGVVVRERSAWRGTSRDVEVHREDDLFAGPVELLTCHRQACHVRRPRAGMQRANGSGGWQVMLMAGFCPEGKFVDSYSGLTVVRTLCGPGLNRFHNRQAHMMTRSDPPCSHFRR